MSSLPKDSQSCTSSGISLSQPNLFPSKLEQAISPTHRLKSLWETKRGISTKNTVPPQPSCTSSHGCTRVDANGKQRLWKRTEMVNKTSRGAARRSTWKLMPQHLFWGTRHMFLLICNYQVPCLIHAVAAEHSQLKQEVNGGYSMLELVGDGIKPGQGAGCTAHGQEGTLSQGFPSHLHVLESFFKSLNVIQ